MSNIKNYMTGDNNQDDQDDNQKQTIKDQIEIIKQQIDKIDKNKDNIVTKDEMKSYFNVLTTKIDKNSDGKVTKDELELYFSDRSNIWKQEYDILLEKYTDLLDTNTITNNNNNNTTTNIISTKALKKYINDEIIESDANLKLVPDAIERKLYLPIYKTMMESLKGLCNTTTIELLNHEIKISIRPIINHRDELENISKMSLKH